jgi:photosynthetic reaction center cytochrome c subunit
MIFTPRLVIATAAVFAVVAFVGLLFTFERPGAIVSQTGYRGVAMEQNYNPRMLVAQQARNQPPEPIEKVEPDGQKASEVYQNVQVLGDLTEVEFLRTMTAITAWVSPEGGCAYCHAEGEELSSDSLYTKVVARRMLQMTREVNTTWQSHVAQTGVTCWTCHRGLPVPEEIWFEDPGRRSASKGLIGDPAGQNAAAPAVGLTSLPNDPFTAFLVGGKDAPIRNISQTALPTDRNTTSIKQAEWTYGLMIHMSEGLGVNCTYCHNSRAFASWEQSPPQRVTAWHGIRMVQALNAGFLDPLRPTYPASRLGPTGDAPKANCATCHQGAYKPLYGAPLAKDHPELTVPNPQGQGPQPFRSSASR